jgi:hypothetical protein
MATTVPITDEAPRAKSGIGIWLGRFDDWLDRTGERLNPILVKECRQSLKGRQFSITFALVLLCCWIWSVWGVMMTGPNVHYGAASVGMDMFAGYFTILAFPLLVIVPFGAFRSLADERDDRTFDLLAITTLSPRQIVAGKLGSAAVQLLVYMSAVSPCLAFTYLLRGIEAPTILLTLGYLALASLGLSALAILAGTLSSERAWQAIWSVVIIVGLLIAFWVAMQFVFEVVVRQRLGLDDREFWFSNVVLVIAYGSYFALVFLAAAARLTFVGENRSTPLRVVMFVQPILLIFCIVWGVVHFREGHGFALDRQLLFSSMPFFCILAMHWYLMGVMMTGESPRLSNRAKRRLPQSFLGRAFLTWFNPGPGTGYLFALSNLAAGLLIVLGGVVYREFVPELGLGLGPLGSELTERADVCLLLFGYVALYLGLGKLLIGLLRRFTSIGIVLAVSLQVFWVLLGCLVPQVIEAMQRPHMHQYTLLYVFDPFSTLGNQSQLRLGLMPAALGIVGVSALGAFFANLPGVVREIRQVRVAKPARVAEEDAARQAPAPAPPPSSPWD